MKGWQVLAPVAALAVTGCLASKSDIKLLQDEIRVLRAMQARADTAAARRAQADSTARMIARTNDSLRALSQRFGGFQSAVTTELYEAQKQLITLQELAGMNSRQIQGLRSSVEDRASAAAAADTSSTAAPPPPGPAQLFQAASGQLAAGSSGAARTGFEELLRLYPEFDQAALAQLYIAETYRMEKRTAEEDSVYSLVVTKYPRTNDAATALFKYGVSQQSQGKREAARRAFTRVTTEFPRSVEAELARERLRPPR